MTEGAREADEKLVKPLFQFRNYERWRSRTSSSIRRTRRFYQDLDVGGARQAIAKDAYVYSYAMMESYQTWRTQAVDKTPNGYVGGFNVFRHYSEPFTPDNKDIVTPNNDTPYSWAWLDLRAEPMVVSVPAVPKDRYYVMQWIDLFTQNFAYIGVRSTGFGAGKLHDRRPEMEGQEARRHQAGVQGRNRYRGHADADRLAGSGGRSQCQGVAGAVQVATAQRLPKAARATGGTYDRLPAL